MFTKEQLKAQQRIAILNTGIKLRIGKDEIGYYLRTESNSEPLSKYGTKDEIYNILFTLNNINEFGTYDHHKSDIYSIHDYHDLSVKCGVSEKIGLNHHVTLKGIAHIMINRKKQLDEKALNEESTKTGIPLNKLRKIKDILAE